MQASSADPSVGPDHRRCPRYDDWCAASRRSTSTVSSHQRPSWPTIFDRVALTIGEEGRRAGRRRRPTARQHRLDPRRDTACPTTELMWTLEPASRPDRPGAASPLRSRRRGAAHCSSASADGWLRVFDTGSFALQRTLRVAPNTLSTIRPLEDGTAVTTGRHGLARVDLTTGAIKWQVSGQETCVNVTVAEQHGVFYCGDPYGRLYERDLRQRSSCAASTPRTATPARCGRRATSTELVSFGTFEPVVARWRLDGSGPSRASSPLGGSRGRSTTPVTCCSRAWRRPRRQTTPPA